MEIQIRKRDGRLEPYQRKKLVKSMTAAGASPQVAGSIASEIEQWMPKVAIEGVVQSSTIREKVLQLLKPQDLKSALAFEQYKK